jgi:subtilisin family serine protease
VFEQLTAVAQRTQPAILSELKASGVEYQSFWISNMIWVRGNTGTIEMLAQRPDVAHLYANPAVKIDPVPPLDTAAAIQAVQGIEWNIDLVNAPDLWAIGITGQDIVIGGQDTGYDWDHAGLKNQYRGWDGAITDHNYNWHDAIHSGGGVCGADSAEPCDDHGHGTHTMGTMAGNDLLPTDPNWPDGAANAVGMAPGAKWIGCRNMDVGTGTPATYAECYQWFIAPTDLNGQNPDPAKAPHVINNSWACPTSEGCTDPNVLLTVVENVRAAGIVTAHSAGNSGSSCSSINTPAAIYDASFTVAATTSSDTIVSFSSRGPVTVDGSNRFKPDISAPGQSIRSTTRYDNYGSMSGTSMAAPHVAGLVALILDADPTLIGQVDAIEQLIRDTAVPKTTTDGCGGDTSTAVPNHTFGYGRIDAQPIVDMVLPYRSYFPILMNE